ncbi:carbohydrate ABC transporter permease [Lachnospiraceae bacterium OttesenSCG-928-J05]|nr:carbohydrate ABC transporter permease [Lachnospiraceae bacterium OttesenSCG-928-J05]
MAAYVFARCEFRGKNLIYFILSLAMVIPMTALLHPVYNVIQTLGLYDTKMGLIIVYMALNLPMSLLIMRGTFLSVPQALEEAAYVDGASFVRTFFQIMLPCAKGGLTSSAVLAFLGSWNEFTFALMLTSGQAARTLPLSLSYFTAQFSFNYTAMFAAVTIAVIPSILVFAIFQEQVVSSLTAGSVKG